MRDCFLSGWALKKNLCVYIYNVCVHICVCIYRYVCATLVCEARVKVKSQASSSTFFEAGLFVVFLQYMVDWLAKRFWGLSVSLSLISLEHWDWRHELHSFTGYWGFEAGIHTCVAHVLPTEPSIVPAQKRVSFKTEGKRQILWPRIIETIIGNQRQENDWGIMPWSWRGCKNGTHSMLETKIWWHCPQALVIPCVGIRGKTV